ncbi:MAG TPA: glycosyltransferase 87 family protein, partial [Gemmatimonadales bacterium]|nr:glycosyltransferase 87 family protein [Gemmatimonadales bacterium]
ALGLLLFKPQYALPMLALLLIRGEWTVGLVTAAVGGVEYLAGAAVAGWSWPTRLADAIRFFAAEERVANGPTLISLPEWFDFNLGAGSVGLIAAALLCVAVAVAWWRTRAERRFAAPWALAVCAILLASLHTQHYDVAVLLLPALLLLDDRLRSGRPVTPAGRLALLAAYFAYPTFLLGRTLGIQPLVLLPVAALAWAAVEMRGAKLAVRPRGT